MISFYGPELEFPILGLCAIIALKERRYPPWKGLTYIEQDRIDTTPLIPHRFKPEDFEAAYRIFKSKLDGVIKIAVIPQRRESNGIRNRKLLSEC